MRQSRSSSGVGARRAGVVVLVWCAASLVLFLLPVTAAAQLNQTLHNDGWILAAAHTPGMHGSIWRTDLWVKAVSHGGAATLYFCEAGEDGSSAPGYALEFGEGLDTVYVEDVVDHFLDVGDEGWLGAIHYVSTSDVQVYARVYSISSDGSETYGQVIEGVPTADMTMAYNSPDYPGTVEDQWMFAMKHTADGRYRVNIGIVNPTPVASRFWASIFDATGNHPPGFSGAVEVQLPPYSMIQLSDPFAEVAGGEWSSYTARVEAEEPGSGAFGYASVVDNATNDAYFVRGVKIMRPDE